MAWWQKKKVPEPVVVSTVEGDDFSGIDSRESAEALHHDGKLSLVYLMPREAGGPDGALNTVYVPERAKREKERIDASLLEVVRQGGDVHYSAKPAYRGASFIPSQITISVSGSVSAVYVLDVW